VEDVKPPKSEKKERKPADKKIENPVDTQPAAEAPKAEEAAKPAAAPESPSEEKREVTLEQVRRAALLAMGKHSKAAVLVKMSEFGITDLKELQPIEYPQFLDALEEL
jgi:hypothetical protein